MAKNNVPVIVRIQVVNKVGDAIVIVVFKLAHQANIVALMNRRTRGALHFDLKTLAFQFPPQQISRRIAFACA